MISIVNHISDV